MTDMLTRSVIIAIIRLVVIVKANIEDITCRHNLIYMSCAKLLMVT